MPKKKKSESISPDPLPKVGDAVNYILGEKHILCPAKITKIHEGHSSRLVDLEVITPEGAKQLENAVWEEVVEAQPLAGNSWHWAEEETK